MKNNRRKVRATKKTKKQLLDLIYTTRIEADKIREEKLKELRDSHEAEKFAITEVLRAVQIENEQAAKKLISTVEENNNLKTTLAMTEGAANHTEAEFSGYRKALVDVVATITKCSR